MGKINDFVEGAVFVPVAEALGKAAKFLGVEREQIRLSMGAIPSWSKAWALFHQNETNVYFQTDDFGKRVRVLFHESGQVRHCFLVLSASRMNDGNGREFTKILAKVSAITDKTAMKHNPAQLPKFVKTMRRPGQN